jgi:type I site-specific restriction endonuclease
MNELFQMKRKHKPSFHLFDFVKITNPMYTKNEKTVKNAMNRLERL